MDNKQIFHIAGEIVVVGCISIYFINQIKKLNEEISGLKDELKSQKEMTNRNFNQIYAILNTAFNIPMMPQTQAAGTGSQSKGNFISDESEQKTKRLPIIEKNASGSLQKSEGSPKDEEESDSQEDEFVSIMSNTRLSEDNMRKTPMPVMTRENFAHSMIGGVSFGVPIGMSMGMQMGMPIDGIIINMEDGSGPRKRNVQRNMEVEITELKYEALPTLRSESVKPTTRLGNESEVKTGAREQESHLMIEDKEDIEEDVTDKEIQKELESLGINVETKDSIQIENDFVSEGGEEREIDMMPEVKTVKTAKRKKNLKNSS